MIPQSLRRPAAVIGLIGVLCTMIGCDGVRTVSDRDIELMPVTRLRELMEKQAQKPDGDTLLLFDVRAQREFDEGHLPRAEQLALQQVPNRIRKNDRIERFDHVVIYGEHPADPPTRALAKRLMSRKYGDIYVYDGGIADWRSRGLPLEAAAPASSGSADSGGG